jgi:hypothetical protein
LRTLGVRYHRLSPYRSLLDRLHDLLEPPADAQQPVGPVRSAAWLAPGMIVVSGSDAHVSWRPGGGVEHVVRPAGLSVIDTRRWEVRTVDEQAASFMASEHAIVTDGDGVAVHVPGRDVARVLDGRRVEALGTAGTLGYVREGRAVHVVDLDAGRIVATRAGPRTFLLLEPGRGPWG